MTEKRFKLRLSRLENGMITDTQKREDLYFDKEFLDVILQKTNEWLNELAEENEQLKQELIELKKWEKYVGDVKRDDLDKVFKMSIYEIAEAFAYYEKRIKELEE